MSQVKTICKKYKVKPNSKGVEKLRKILDGKFGYFPKFAQWYFEKKCTLDNLKDIMDLLDVVKINRPISSFRTNEELYDHVTQIQNKQKLNQVLKSIPSRVRRNVSQRIKDAIFNNIDKEKLLKDFFSTKGGTCKTEDNLYQRTMEVIHNSSGKYSYKAVLRKIRWKLFFLWVSHIFIKSPGKIVYKDGKTIIVKINTFIASKALGSIHWCISRTLSYWNQYTIDDRAQYFVFQTEYDMHDSKSMIGVTVHPGKGSIYAAHLKNDCEANRFELEDLYGRYLSGKDIKIESIEDLQKYNIYDLEYLYKIDNWEQTIKENKNSNYFLEISKKLYNKWEQSLKNGLPSPVKNLHKEPFFKEIVENTDHHSWYSSETLRKLCFMVNENDFIETYNDKNFKKFIKAKYNQFVQEKVEDIYRKYSKEYKESVEIGDKSFTIDELKEYASKGYNIKMPDREISVTALIAQIDYFIYNKTKSPYGDFLISVNDRFGNPDTRFGNSDYQSSLARSKCVTHKKETLTGEEKKEQKKLARIAVVKEIIDPIVSNISNIQHKESEFFKSWEKFDEIGKRKFVANLFFDKIDNLFVNG